jgi:hypothetical protein
MENESTSNQGSGGNQGGGPSQGTQSTTTQSGQQVLPQRNPQVVTRGNPPGNLQKSD